MLRTMIRSAYDLQRLRIETGNRIVAQFKSKLGYKPSTKEKDSLDDEGQDLLTDLKTRFKKLTEGVARELPAKKQWKGDGVVSTYTEACLLHQYFTLEKNEASQFRRLEQALEEFPIYTEFLSGVRGCGAAMSAVIISEIDITKARYVSSIWKYAGLDVEAGSGRSRRKEHLITVPYVNKAGEEAKRLAITFNPFLKTKLTGVLASCLIKAGNERYRAVYDGYKHRLENHVSWSQKTKAHRHNAAMRYMIKIFLMDLYAAWRPLEGLETHLPYGQAKLGHREHGGDSGRKAA